MTDRQSTHSHDCCGCGPKHYEYEVWQDGVLQAGGREADYASAQSEASHYAAMYTPDGPVEVLIYEKRLLSAVQQPAEQQEGERDWLAEAMDALAEWRFDALEPEKCDAQQPSDNEVVFIDGVGAGRSSIKSCRDGVQWIMVGDRVYWPLSDSDAKRLQSACCGNGSFDGPATPASEGRTAMADRYERIRRALAMGPTPGPWRVVEIIWVGGSDMGFGSVTTTDGTIICDLRDRPYGDAALIAASDTDTIRELLAERDQLAAELEAVKRDAERYRWLRKGESYDIAVVRGLGALAHGMSEVFYTYSDEIYGDALDAAIDAAMSKEGK